MRGKRFRYHSVFWLGMIILYVLTAWPKSLSASEGPFQFQQVITQAKQLAAGNFQQPSEIPDFLKNITYDQLRDIRFKNSYTLWGNERGHFKIRFFHLGFYYHWPVVINYVDGNGVHPFKFSPDMFDYGKNDFKLKVPADLGFAGFRIHYPINTSAYDDEIAVFLGATYFRALGRGQGYGLSARGLAINTALDIGEEFPFFKEFWIIKPRKNDKEITVYALLDSASVSGAYEYIIHPGKETLIQVKSTLFIRKKIGKLGISPLTSMFFYGENSRADHYDGLRPEVHDSDGLQILARSGEWIWRPLIDPKELMVNTFEVGTPQGFGLFQRDTNFDHYQDLESRFDLRPSVWVTPGKDWGAGHVELVQIPSDDERNDNINAFWVPQNPPDAGQTLDFSYTLTWCWAQSKNPPEGYVTDTRVQRQSNKESARFEIDFQGKEIDAISSGSDLTADISVTQGYTILDQQVFKNTVTGGWRLVFRIQLDKQGPLKDVLPEKRPAVGLRAFLKKGSHPLSETWDYVLIP